MLKSADADAVRLVACPRCKQPAGEHCRLHSGWKKHTPHLGRIQALMERPGFNWDDYYGSPTGPSEDH